MFEFFAGLNPVYQALLAGLFTWAMTAVGAAIVFPCRNFNRRLLNTMLGFAAGIMLAASVWSLLIPSMELSGEWGSLKWVPGGNRIHSRGRINCRNRQGAPSPAYRFSKGNSRRNKDFMAEKHPADSGNYSA
ncbi:ZIP family metal transporter [Methanolacinia petrolearia]|uniref:ZIP family metal transporter n=1 Tax=Methanolacinia petrolearia TaxID=54120 RepID=UPI003BA9EA68